MIRKVLPPIWFVLFLGSALLVHFFVPALRVFDLQVPYGTIIGLLLFFLGFYLPLWASKIFAEEKTEILPTSPTNRVLVTRGPFLFSRNPMYLGTVVMLFGIAVIIGTLPMFAAAFAQFLVMNFIFIPFEEEKMRRQFNDAFTDYTKRVRRWL